MSEKYSLKVTHEQRNQIIKLIDSAVDQANEGFTNHLKWFKPDSVDNNQRLLGLRLALEVQVICERHKFEEVVEEEEE